MATKDDVTETIEKSQLSDIIKKYEEANHEKLERSLKDYVDYFRTIYKQLGLDWTEQDSKRVSSIFDAILERAKLEAIQILISTAEEKKSQKPSKSEIHEKVNCMKQ